MHWPTPQDYNESVQMPEYSFSDEQLARGSPELTPIGLPKPVTGNFASVYRFDTDQKRVAVKCFLRFVQDQQERYKQISAFMAANPTRYIVDFEYMEHGIRVKADWYPILKMAWVEGVTLDQFLRKNVANKPAMEKITNQFLAMIKELKRIGIAHGDLQHGNILVQPSDIRLVDYDGMFVPSLSGKVTNELGHSNYQHPKRSAQHFSPATDDFSAWLIHSSLLVLLLDPLLFKKFAGGDECILFRHTDLKDPSRSRLFRELLAHPNAQVKARGELIKRLAECPIERVPPFADTLPKVDTIPVEVRKPETPAAADTEVPTAGKPNFPDWMLPDDVTATVCDPKPVKGSVQKRQTRPVPSHLKQPPRLPSKLKWPTLEQYEKAVVAPASSFRDAELASASPFVKLKIKGKHGIVYQLTTNQNQYAVKCFIEELSNREERYKEVAKIKEGPLGKYFVEFTYFTEGIKVQDNWFPCLKMNWQQGETIDKYACGMLSINNRAGLDRLIDDFRAMLLMFLNHGIAHGDLEPSNIIIDPAGAIKLVDYDAMYAPTLKNLAGGEAGSPLYQHPTRNSNHFGPWSDNFPALLIDSVLTAMAATGGIVNNPNWDNFLQLVRPRNWSQSDPYSPVTRRSRLIKEMQMTKIENVPPLNTAIKL